MKRILLLIACGLLTLAQALAQPGGGMFWGRQIERDSALVAEYSEFMVEKYKLNEQQAGRVRKLNTAYVGKVSYPISRTLREKVFKAREGSDLETTEKKQSDSTVRAIREQFRNMENMSEEQRQEMFGQMQKRMEEAQAARELQEENEAEYEEALQQILDKNQFKAYKKELRREEEREQRRRESEMRRQFERGGFGGFGGGGFGGSGGGGFGGGDFGGGF